LQELIQSRGPKRKNVKIIPVSINIDPSSKINRHTRLCIESESIAAMVFPTRKLSRSVSGMNAFRHQTVMHSIFGNDVAVIVDEAIHTMIVFEEGQYPCVREGERMTVFQEQHNRTSVIRNTLRFLLRVLYKLNDASMRVLQ
jgi:hypothetical protein